MNDFAIRVKKIPHQSKYDDNDEVLRAHLIQHFEQIVRDEYIRARVDRAYEDELRLVTEEEIDQQVAKQFEKETDITKLNPRPWEVADVCFG